LLLVFPKIKVFSTKFCIFGRELYDHCPTAHNLRGGGGEWNNGMLHVHTRSPRVATLVTNDAREAHNESKGHNRNKKPSWR